MDGDAPEPIEVELISHEPPPERSGRWRRDSEPSRPAEMPVDETEPSVDRTERSRLVVVAAVVAVVALTLGWVIGRTTSGDADVVADDPPETTRRTTTTVDAAVVTLPIVGEDIGDPDFGPDDPVVTPGTAPTDVDEPAVDGPTVDGLAVDPRLGAAAVRLVGVELGGDLVEADLAAGTLAQFDVDRIVSDGSPLVVGPDWVVASPVNGRARVIWSDGTESTLALGDYWRLLAVPGEERFWRGSFGPDGSGAGEFELVDLAGAPIGPVVETPANSWPVLVDPRTGGVVVSAAGRSYVVVEDDVEYLGTGQIISLSDDAVVAYDCDEQLACSLYVTDRRTGEASPVPPDPAFDEPIRWDSTADWGGGDSTISPDGRWAAVIGSTWRSSVSGIFDLTSGRFVELAEVSAPPSIVWSSDSRFAFYVDDLVPTAYDTVTGERFPVFSDVVQWLQLGARPPTSGEPAADGPTLL